MGRGTKIALGIGGGCIVLVLLLLVGFVGCVALIGSTGGSKDSKSGSSKGEQPAVAIGQPVTVGDVTWTVTNARQADRLSQQGAPKGAGKTEQGNFVIVDFDFTNNGTEPANLSTTSLALLDSEGRESEPDSDKFLYIPRERNIFVLDRINPGVTEQGQVIFTVAPGASGFTLQLGDGRALSNETGQVNLGI